MINQPFPRRLAVAALIAACSTLAMSQMNNDSVTLEYARKELEAGKITLIDIREPQEHASGVAKGAKLLPMRQISSRISEIPIDAKRPVLLICNTQNRSSATFNFLRDNGFTNVRYVQGGMSEWIRRGWPVVSP
jgi:rhodanese-related sulfurtransferase